MNIDDLVAVDWLEPWGAVHGPVARGLEVELGQELEPGHPLYGWRAVAVGRRFDVDDVLYFIPGGEYPLAVVRLLWREKVNGEDSSWPRAALYTSLEEWVERCMKPNHVSF